MANIGKHGLGGPVHPIHTVRERAGVLAKQSTALHKQANLHGVYSEMVRQPHVL